MSAGSLQNFFLFIVVLFTIGITRVSACEITLEIIENKKEIYSIGDTLVVKVNVIFTHRICPEGIKNTKFQLSGIKVIGAKEWVENSPGVYERELKLLITGTNTGKVSISAVRKCEKEGGIGSLTLKAEAVKN